MGFVRKTGVISSIVLCAIAFLHKPERKTSVLLEIQKSGFIGELHHTTTEDGYILGIHRLFKPNDVKNSSREHKSQYPILFVHGLESSAADWIAYQGNNSLPYLLLEEGYDVWLGNIRGTQASLNHTSLDPNVNPKEFWNTSINEIGYFDLPAMIDYILNITRAKKIFYVGISQGEATFLIMTSERPEYNEKIKLAVLTSPSSHLKHSDNVVMKMLGNVWPIIEPFRNLIRLYTVPGRDVLGHVCQYKVLLHLCNKIVSPFIGYADPEQMVHTNELFRVPVKSALKQLIHYLQIFKSGLFRKFDYGEEGNLKHYGAKEPPEYDLNKVVAPISYFWGENDCWSRPKDVADIESKLPNMVLSYKIPHKDFNHYDLIIGKEARSLAYDKIIEIITKFNETDA